MFCQVVVKNQIVRQESEVKLPHKIERRDTFVFVYDISQLCILRIQSVFFKRFAFDRRSVRIASASRRPGPIYV